MSEFASEKLNESVFTRLDWGAFWASCAIAFGIYAWTVAPTVTLEDGGELATAGMAMGVPHPPGYPIWSLLAWCFTKLFAFVPFRGQPNPSWSIGLMSAVFGALASGVTALLICRSGRDILEHSPELAHNVDRRTRGIICWVGGVVSSLLFAFSPVMWSQSVIVEVYSLNAFFLLLIFLLVYMWIRRPSDKMLYITAFFFGLGLTNYQVLLLAALALVAALMLRDVQLFRDLLIVGAPYMLVIALMKAGWLPPIKHPTDITCVVYMTLNFGVLALAYFTLPRGKTVAVTFLLVELGVAFYGYMPIVSDLRNPPMNWGYPRTWEGFKHAITRGQYERIVPADAFSLRYIHQLGSYLTDLREQFTLPIALLGFLPFTIWRITLGKHRLRAMYAAITLAIAATAVVTFERALLPPGALAPLYKLLIGVILLLLVTGGTAVFIRQAKEQWLKLVGRTPAPTADRVTVALMVAGAALVFLGYVGILLSRIVSVTEPLRKTGAAVSSEQVQQIFLGVGGILMMIVLPILLIAAVTWLMESRHKLHMTIDHDSEKWIIATLFGFLAMSLVLIALANPKGDIQDTFIQRVKFISSHALYALWIGYGLIFGLASVYGLFPRNRALCRTGLCVALILPLAPLHQNWYNSELIRKSGGAEQNGHDFGWQFGNYQLRGAEAISEELDPAEEPLPDPTFPLEMGPEAIFFGGTDPGRFVPTYMIYGAKVREDVYLITQNALADNTYMSVMRDLYGDRIWIPAQPDSAKAFQIYVEEVQSGKRPRNAQLTIEGGRVQVSGALGVMEINGILARMIFDHNNYKNDFYVEESYVIQWMYPFLTPHGLIMKINAEQTPLSAQVIRQDSDFWDWYTRRLMSDTKFLRDVVARKSFSKLRSAIAGLYSSRGRLREAENAFQHARTLYPLSPEANFRLVQEVFMRERRFGEAQQVMQEFGDADPGNTKVPDFLGHLDRISKLEARIGECEELMKTGKLDVNKAVELADLYRQAGRIGQLNQLADGLLRNTDLPAVIHYRVGQLLFQAQQFGPMVKAFDQCLPRMPPDMPPNILLDIARMYATANQHAKMGSALEIYLKRQPADWKAWLDLAAVHLLGKKVDEARQALQRAIAIGGNEALEVISKDQRFAPLQPRLPTAPPTRDLLTLPGVVPGR